MREKIYFLAKGNFTYESAKLVIEPEKLEIEVVTGTKTSATFTVSDARHDKIKGFGFAEAAEITFLPVFEGEENVLGVEVDASELIAGTVLRGKLILVTDRGEEHVPYEINVVAPELTDEEGEPVRDYYTLIKKTERDREAGLKLFRDPVFRDTFLYRDFEGQLIYDKLSKGNTGLSGMEEFLVGTGKKKPVRFLPEYTGSAQTAPDDEDGTIRLNYELAGNDIEDSIMLNLSAWGSVMIRVEKEGDFIETDRKLLWTDEFSDLRGRLGLTIIAGRVSEGRHHARIRLVSPYETHVIEISVHSPVGYKERKIARAKQAVWGMLIRSLLAYEEGRVEKSEFKGFLQKHRSVLERLDLRFSMPLKGYMAYLLESEAARLEFYRDTERMSCPDIGADQTEVENYILIQYIKYLYSNRQEELDELRALVDRFAENGYMSTILMVISMRCNPAQYGADARCVERIRELLTRSAATPVLYSELMRRYVAQPDLLRELDALNLRVLLYGLRQGLITNELCEVITVLSGGRGLPPIDTGSGLGYGRDNDLLRKGTGALLMQVLFGVYELTNSVDTLRNICTLLIRYEKRDRRYFPWYERGVNERLRLTDLFEYYMYTIDPQTTEPLPQIVLSYFQFENHMNDARKAFLYANIVRNREINPEAFENYEEQIHEFVIDQIGKERVNTDLGYLYREMLKREDVTKELTTHLPHVLFRHLLTCRTEGIESVTLVHMQTKSERSYPLDRGKALLDIYTPEYRIFFHDKEGNRYLNSIDYTLERFFDGDEFALLCYPILTQGATEETQGDGAGENKAVDENNTAQDDNEDVDENEQIQEIELVPADVPDNLLFNLTYEAWRKPRLDNVGLDILYRALQSDKLRDNFHGKVFLRIFDHLKDYVSKDDRMPYLKLLMRYLKPDTIKRSRIGEIATVCVQCKEMEKAATLLKRYGRSGCEEKEFLELTIDRIRTLNYEFEDSLVKWALILYNKGHHDHPILNYLLQYYMGETDTLISLFRDSLPMKRVGTGTDQLESMEGHIKTNPVFYEGVRERLLGQVLFACRDTKVCEDIFLKYYDDGENRVLVKAYLSQMAYEFIVGRNDMSDKIFEKVYRQAMYEKEPVMVLSALKRLVGRDKYNEKERDFIERSLEDMADEGCILPFMKEFGGGITVPYEIRTPVIVQYYSGTPGGVFLFVKNKDGEYVSQPMERVFDGIFTASILLFAGEETKGYIYEEETGKRSKEFQLRKKTAEAGGDSMFEQVNALITAKNDGDDARYERLSRSFVEEQELAKYLFKLL